MSFWDVHGPVGGMFFLLFLTILPRITLFVAVSFALIASAIVSNSLLLGFSAVIAADMLTCLMWLMWLIVPRFLIASIAACLYIDTNPVLCIVAGVIALVHFKIVQISFASVRERSKESSILKQALIDIFELWKLWRSKVKTARKKATPVRTSDPTLFDNGGKSYQLEAIREAYETELRKRKRT